MNSSKAPLRPSDDHRPTHQPKPIPPPLPPPNHPFKSSKSLAKDRCTPEAIVPSTSLTINPATIKPTSKLSSCNRILQQLRPPASPSSVFVTTCHQVRLPTAPRQHHLQQRPIDVLRTELRACWQLICRSVGDCSLEDVKSDFTIRLVLLLLIYITAIFHLHSMLVALKLVRSFSPWPPFTHVSLQDRTRLMLYMLTFQLVDVYGITSVLCKHCVHMVGYACATLLLSLLSWYSCGLLSSHVLVFFQLFFIFGLVWRWMAVDQETSGVCKHCVSHVGHVVL